MMSQMRVPLPSAWESQMEFCALDFSLALPWLSWAFGGVNQWMEALFFFLPLKYFFFLKQKRKQNINLLTILRSLKVREK